MAAMYGDHSGIFDLLPAYWPVYVGSELIYMYAGSDIGEDVGYLVATYAPDENVYRGASGITYSHYFGANIFTSPTFGEIVKSDSMYNTYGVGEVYINPFGIADNNTLDTYCYNALMNSTSNATNARASIPAYNLPATVSIGDWVTIHSETDDYTWLSGWATRQALVIGNTGDALSNYQIKFNIIRSTDTSTATNIYVGTDCLADYNDIRFTNSVGTVLDYWIEDMTVDSATVWVEFDSIAAGSNTFYVYYDNDGATAYSNGTNTFPFFDDFPGSALDTTTNWDVASGSVTVTGGECTITSGKILSKSTYTGPLVLRGRIKYTNANQWKSIGWCKSGANDAHLFQAKNTGTAMIARSNNNLGVQQEAADLGNYCDNAYHTLELAAISSSSFKYYVDGSLGATLTYDIGTSLKIQFEASTSDIIADLILIRKYAATAPTIDSWTSETEDTVTQVDKNYRIVGWEYDQMKGLFNLEFGAPDDYYMSNDVKYKGAVDVSLSLL